MTEGCAREGPSTSRGSVGAGRSGWDCSGLNTYGLAGPVGCVAGGDLPWFVRFSVLWFGCLSKKHQVRRWAAGVSGARA